MPSFRGRPNFVFVYVFDPKNNVFIFRRCIFRPKIANVFSVLFYFRPKNPWKTVVNAINWRTNKTLKSEYFAKVRGFRCNKQWVCACRLYQISAGGASMTIIRRWLHSSNYAVSKQVVKPREPRGEPLNSAPTDRSIRSQCLLGENAEKLLFLAYNIRLFNYGY